MSDTDLATQQPLLPSQTGFIDFKGYKTWFAVYGDLKSGRTPLLALHGGPGYPHWHLQNLSLLANEGIPVILYDQIGCGNSDRPEDPDFYSVELFVEELATVRRELGLDETYVLGTSWGGSLALEYMFTKPTGIKKLILHSPLIDTKLWIEETDKLRDQLPPEVAETLRRHEAAGTTDSEEYVAANSIFNKHFLFRGDELSEDQQMCEKMMSVPVYLTMWGPSESCVTGKLKDWSAIDRLQEIDVPTLWISGKYDECTPRQIEVGKSHIKSSKWVLLEESSHSSNWEQPEEYLRAVKEFLTEDD